MAIKNIIHSEKKRALNPKTAFGLSFFITGLGQFYNGSLSKGIILQLIKIFPFFILPIYTVNQNYHSSIKFIIIIIIISTMITIYAPIEAFIFSKRKKNSIYQKYNSPIYYSIFTSISLILTTLSILLFFSIYTLFHIDSEEHLPILKTGDYILIKKTAVKKLSKGDVILFKKGKSVIGRISATPDEEISYKKNRIYINGDSLLEKVISEKEMEGLKLERYTDLISEKNYRTTYPTIKTHGSKTSFTKKITSGTLLVISDNRRENNFFYEVPVKSITGKVEGVLFSTNFLRIGILPYIKKDIIPSK